MRMKKIKTNQNQVDKSSRKYDNSKHGKGNNF